LNAKLPGGFVGTGLGEGDFPDICGTLFCIGVSFFVDGYSFRQNRWQLGSDPLNDLVIPLLLAPQGFVNGRTDVVPESPSLHHPGRSLSGKHRAAGNPRRGSALVIDVDHFKAVNDRFGHMFGDDALRKISSEIKESVRESDLVGRIGGEEFGVFLPGATRREAAVVAERIRASVNAAKFSPQAGLVPLSVSVGATVYGSRSSFNEMFRLADE
jgi:diguanylate cyclase